MKLLALVTREVKVRGMGRECSLECQFFGSRGRYPGKYVPVCSLDGKDVRLMEQGKTALRSRKARRRREASEQTVFLARQIVGEEFSAREAQDLPLEDLIELAMLITERRLEVE
jgi:hypothetical protein